MDSIFEQSIETDTPGMAGGTSYYDIEDIYQAFKERMIKELPGEVVMSKLPLFQRIAELEAALREILDAGIDASNPVNHIHRMERIAEKALEGTTTSPKSRE